jgi:uncharacterized protein (TIGR03086 family)
MTGPIDVWTLAADNFDRHYEAITDDQWGASTPCNEWTVRELVDHAVDVQTRLGAALGGTAGEGSDWSTVHAAMKAALSAADALDGNINHPAMGEMPKHQVLGIAASDLLLHSWDLARAIGADGALPAAAVEAVALGLQRMPAEFMRSPGRFGPEIEVGDDAGPQDRLLAFSGRQP